MANSSNIRVICRVRPLIDYEASDINSQEIISYSSSNTLLIGEDSELETFSFDEVFPPSSEQLEVYDKVGKPTIDDILMGYNGTIFAYGQTGSGKTHTMLGSLLEEEEKGIIPRAVSQIFLSIENDETETEYTLKCSMLEIYKETLRDLLELDSTNLQIKECPRRGIYVKGLTEVCVMNDNEVIDLLCLGQQFRTVASTRLNSSSSRSHFIFFLELNQRFVNDSEKKGRLNLIDLAGSEKISHSGVTGNNLEEAKKINLSLSALGKVIHSLISNNDHIPYRDSKLTRILQESLGGNFKTTLLVTCSPSARSQSETMDSLRFAVRAKAIKNKAKVNLKNPPENYIKMIEMLKSELINAKNEIKSLRGRVSPVSDDRFQSKSGHIRKKSAGNKPPNMPTGCKPSQLSDIRLTVTSEHDLSYFPAQEKNMDELVNISNLNESENERLLELMNSAVSEKESLTEKVKELEEKLLESKKKQLSNEQKFHELYQNYSTSINLLHKDSTEIAMLRSKSDGLQKQVNRLTKILEENERKYKTDLGAYRNIRENTLHEFKLTELSRSDIPVLTQNQEETRTLSFSSLFLTSEPSQVSSKYSESLRKALEDPSYFNKDFIIYLLKQQILQAAITNNELSSTISALNWKISLIKQKYGLKRDLCKYQQDHIKKLEEIIDFLHKSYNKIASITEKIELSSVKPKDLTRNKTLRLVTNKFALTSRSNLKRPTESSKNTSSQLQAKLEDPSLPTRIKELESNLDLQKLFNVQLKRNNDIFKTQAQKYLEVLNDFEKTSVESERSQRNRWKGLFEDMSENAEKELMRKQEEIITLNSVLAGWVNSFMSMQEAVGQNLVTSSQYSDLMDLINNTTLVLQQIKNPEFRTVSIPQTRASPPKPILKGDFPI